MKKLFVALLCLMLVGCSSEEPQSKQTTPEPTETTETTPEPTESTEAENVQELLFQASGSGDDVVTGFSTDTAVIINITNTGSGYFSIWAHGDSDDLLVSSADNYTGTVILKTGGDITFEVSSGGDWTIDIYNNPGISDTDSFSGNTDMVTPVSVSTNDSYTITANGEGYFSVWAYSQTKSELLVSDSAPYEGTVYLGMKDEPVFFEVSAIGIEWSISPAE